MNGNFLSMTKRLQTLPNLPYLEGQLVPNILSVTNLQLVGKLALRAVRQQHFDLSGNSELNFGHYMHAVLHQIFKFHLETYSA